MGPLRVATWLVLCWLCAATAAYAQQAPPSAPPDPAEAEPGAQEDPFGAGYEPDQRGALEEEPEQPDPFDQLDAPADADLHAEEPPAGPPEAEEEEIIVTGARIKRTDYSQPTSGKMLYLELRLGADFLQPPRPAPARGGLLLGAAAGLHLGRDLQLGLRYGHGLHGGGVGSDLLALDARYAPAAWGPQLRLGAGPVWLGGLDGGALGGAELDLGLGLSTAIGEHLTLGGGLDFGILWLEDETSSALKLHLDLGFHL